MHMRMDRICAARLVARNVDVVIGGAQWLVDDVIMSVQPVVRAGIVFGRIGRWIAAVVIEKRGEDEVAINGKRGRHRGVGRSRNDQSVGMQIGRVQGRQRIVVDALDRRRRHDGH